jgi:hypothetical protein
MGGFGDFGGGGAEGCDLRKGGVRERGREGGGGGGGEVWREERAGGGGWVVL